MITELTEKISST